MGENEEQPILRSINCEHKSYVKFINTTAHNVVLYWIDYKGEAVSYGRLVPRGNKDIDTFVTHPWIFVDEETTERYTAKQKDAFFPEPWVSRQTIVDSREMGGPFRTRRACVFITLPLYTLRELSLRAIKRRLRSDRHAFKLDIPRNLQRELAMTLPRKTNDQQEDS